MLDYYLVPTNTEPDDLLFQSEKRFNWNMLSRSRANPCPINPGVENESAFRKASNDRSEVLMEVNSKGKSSIIGCTVQMNFRKKISDPSPMEDVSTIATGRICHDISTRGRHSS